jgi:hypothetical protein
MGLRYLGNIIRPGYNPLGSNITTGVNTAQYQGVFTLQQQSQAQSQQQWVTDPNFRNTTLLLQADNAANGAQNNTFLDSSTNSFSITRNGNTTQGTFTPFSQGWSNFFGGYAVGSAAVFTSSTSTFTIEGWIFPTAAAISTSNIPAVIGDMQPTSTAAYWSFGTLASGAVTFYWFDGGSKNATTSTTVPLNVWTHIAVSVNANAITIYINGVQQSLTGTTTLTNRTGSNSSIAFGQFSNAGSLYTGYVSNFSVLSGTAKYSGNFVPSTTPLPTNTTNQTLLFAASNGFLDSNTATTAKTFTIAGTPSVQPFAPFAPQFQYTQSVIGGSGFFDGTGDSLSVANNSAFDLSGSTSWCIETWAYYNTLSGEQNIVEKFTAPSGPGWTLYKLAPNNINGALEIYGGTSSFNSAHTPVAGQWIHIVCCRNDPSGRTSWFINGSRTATTTSFSIASNASTPLLVGARVGGSNNYNGYLCGTRVIKGSSEYDPSQTTITVPNSPPTNITNTSLLLNYTNAGIIDGTMDNVLETVGNAQVSTSVVKYGSGSMFFDGNGDYLTAPNAGGRFDFGLGDFTIEFWMYAPSGVLSFGDTIISKGPPGTVDFTSWTIQGSGTGGNIDFMGPFSTIYATTTSTPWTSGWVHVAMCRAGSNTRCFVNGLQVGSTYTTLQNFEPGNPLIVGSGYFDPAGRSYNGYLDDVRITKGVARYITNFTPPQVALPRQ